jgi:hypothetical protein
MPRVLISDKLESAGLDLLRQAGFELDERDGQAARGVKVPRAVVYDGGRAATKGRAV